MNIFRLFFWKLSERDIRRAKQIKEMFELAEREGYTYRVTRYGGIERIKLEEA